MAKDKPGKFDKYPSVVATQGTDGKWAASCPVKGCATSRNLSSERLVRAAIWSHLVVKHNADPSSPVG